MTDTLDHDTTTLYVTDAELIRRMGVPEKIARAALHALDRACGVPKAIRNMDSRAGAITEATDAGANLENIRQAATHSDIAMTQRYSRGQAEKIENVQLLRLEKRNKDATKA